MDCYATPIIISLACGCGNISVNFLGILSSKTTSEYHLEPNATEIEQGIGSEVDHFVYRVPKKNHDLTVQLGKEFGDIIRNYGVAHLVFQLNNTEAPMDGITNIAKTISATQDEEVWLELMFYR